MLRIMAYTHTLLCVSACKSNNVFYYARMSIGLIEFNIAVYIGMYVWNFVKINFHLADQNRFRRFRILRREQIEFVAYQNAFQRRVFLNVLLSVRSSNEVQ